MSDEIKEEVKEEVKQDNNEVKVYINTDSIKDSLSNINKTLIEINEKTEIDEEKEDTNFYVSSNKKGEKCLVDEKNEKMSDYNIFKKVLLNMEYGKKAPNVHPDFVKYMEEYVKNVDNGGDVKEFMDKEIYKEVALEDLIF